MDRVAAQIALADRATSAETLAAIAQEFPEMSTQAASHPNARLAPAQSARPLTPPPRRQAPPDRPVQPPTGPKHAPYVELGRPSRSEQIARKQTGHRRPIIAVVVGVIVVAVALVAWLFVPPSSETREISPVTPGVPSTTPSVAAEPNSCQSFEEFAILYQVDNLNSWAQPVEYIVGKVFDDGWRLIMETTFEYKLFGCFEDRLYYSSEIGLQYIDLASPHREPVVQLRYPEPKDESSSVINQGVIVGSTLYFGMNTIFGAGHPMDGLLSMDIRSTSWSTVTQIAAGADFDWQYDHAAGVFYFSDEGDSGDSSTSSVGAYQVSDGQLSTIVQDVWGFQYYPGGYILYFDTESDLHLLELANGKNTVIVPGNSVPRLDSNSPWGFAFYSDGAVYYRDGINVVRYENGQRNPVFTMASADRHLVLDYLLPFREIPGAMIISLSTAEHKRAGQRYLIDGKVFSEVPDSLLVAVTDSDGVEAHFSPLCFDGNVMSS